MIERYIIYLSLFSIISGAGYLYYKDSKDSIARLTKENAELIQSIESLDKTLQAVREERERYRRSADKLSQDLKRSEQYIDGLSRKLREHDLTNLALRKPILIEKRVNDATKKLFDDIRSDATDGM